YVVNDALVVSGNLSGQVLAVQTVTASGKVTLNGAMPQILDSSCASYPYYAAQVTFYETTHGYSITQDIDCSDAAFAFSTSLFPGTYQVSVQGGGSNSNLPSTSYVVNDALVVSGNLSGQVLAVQTVTATGKVTLNGAMPQILDSSCASYPYYAAQVTFYETTHGYSITQDIDCSDSAFAFSASLFPGTYRISVQGGGSNSNLPSTDFVAIGAQSITANTSGLVLAVQTYTVSGKVTMNGATPQVLDSSC